MRFMLLVRSSAAAEYLQAWLRFRTSGYVVTKEREEVVEGLLVRGAGQAHVVGDQVVHDTS